jgi:hypothetical protein
MYVFRYLYIYFKEVDIYKDYQMSEGIVNVYLIIKYIKISVNEAIFLDIYQYLYIFVYLVWQDRYL